MTIALPTDTRHWRSGLSHAVRAEWTKLATLRSTKWALLVAVIGTVLVSYLSTHGVERHRPPLFYVREAFDPTNSSLAGFALASLIIGVLSVLSMTGEYGSGTIRYPSWRPRVARCSSEPRPSSWARWPSVSVSR